MNSNKVDATNWTESKQRGPGWLAKVPGRVWGVVLPLLALAALGLVYLSRCAATAETAVSLEQYRFGHQAVFNIMGICLGGAVFLAGWRRILASAPYVLGTWLAMFAGAHFCPRINGELWLRLGPVGLNVMLLLPAVAALFLAWLAAVCERRRGIRATRFVAAVAAACAVLLAAAVLASPERRADLASRFRGESASAEVVQRAERRGMMQKKCVEAFREARWFSPGAPAAGDGGLPVRFAFSMPANSALMFGRWFPALCIALFGAFGLALASCWRRSADEAGKVFAFFAGVAVIAPAALGFGACLGLAPMLYVGVPLVSFGGTAVIAAWLLAAALAAMALDARPDKSASPADGGCA